MPALLSHLIDEAALREPEGVAIRCAASSLSFEQLSRKANGLAQVLLEAGLPRRGRVAVLLAKSPKVAVAFYGVFAAGGILVPIDPKSPAEQIARILQATGVKYLVTEPGKGAVARKALASCPEVKHILGLEMDDSGRPCHCLPWATLDEAATDRPPPLTITEMDPAYVLHTSGSTGIPKLIQHTHRSAMSFVEWAAAEYSLTREDRLTNHSSHHTCFATFDYFAAALAGATTVLLTPAVMMMPASLGALLEEERISVWYSVPTALVQLSLRGDLEARDLRHLRWVLFAGETFPEKHLHRLRQQLPKSRFSHVYGSTETNVCTYYHLPETLPAPDGRNAPLPIGKACSSSSTLVVDEALRPLPDGEVGELLVRGSTVMSGYWGEPERNRRVLVPRPADGDLEETYFRTGDRVRVLDDGNLTFVARADLQIKVRGFRVELEEIETALLSIDTVEEAVAFGVPDGEGSSTLLAAVVGGPITQEDIFAALRSLLPLHSIPAHVTLLDVLPRTPTGKVDRKALQARLTP